MKNCVILDVEAAWQEGGMYGCKEAQIDRQKDSQTNRRIDKHLNL